MAVAQGSASASTAWDGSVRHRPAPFVVPAAAAPLVLAATAAAFLVGRRRRRCQAFALRGRAAIVACAAEEFGDGAIVKTEDGESSSAIVLTERQQTFWEMLEEDFEDEVVPVFGKEALLRVYDFIKYCKQETPIPPLAEGQEIFPEFFPGLRGKPWWEPEELEGTLGKEGGWIDTVREGLPYVQGELADLLEDNEEVMISDSVSSDVMGGGWAGFRLRRLGDWMSRNCELFPKTVQLLKESGCPLAMRGVILARQAPNSGVSPHSDGRNCFLTAHFGLCIPPDCDMTVGGETREWKEDDVVILDTSFTHSTRNGSDEDRFVLIIDFWHPDMTEAEREGLEFIYDYRTKFEKGIIKYNPKLPTDFWENLYVYSAWGGAYTEENYQKPKEEAFTLGGFTF